MLNIVDNFYKPHDLGIMALGFVNLPFSPTYQSKSWPISHRMQGYPCWETEEIPFEERDIRHIKFFETCKRKIIRTWN